MDQTAQKVEEADTEAKLNLIAQKIAEEQRRVKTEAGIVDDRNLVDPADEFACEGCQ